MAEGKSWEGYRELQRQARAANAVRPNQYHYFADRYAPSFASPHEHEQHARRVCTCGRSKDRPMIFRRERYCSDRCRKLQGAAHG